MSVERYAVSVISRAIAKETHVEHEIYTHAITDILMQREKRIQRTAEDLRKDLFLRETKLLQSSLAPFLTTPLRSDAAEVDHILDESFRRIIDGLQESSTPRILHSSCGEFLLRSHGIADPEGLLAKGVQYLSRLVTSTEGSNTLSEDLFVLEGAVTLSQAAELTKSVQSKAQNGRSLSMAWAEILDIKGDFAETRPDKPMYEVLVLISEGLGSGESALDVGRRVFESSSEVRGIARSSLLHMAYPSVGEVQVRLVFLEEDCLRGIGDFVTSLSLVAGGTSGHTPSISLLVKQLVP